MARKKKSNKKNKGVDKSSNKSSKKVSKGNSSKTPKKAKKTPKKSSNKLTTSKGKQLKKAFSKILSKETWREKPGRAPRRKSIKLTTQGDKNRYQQIVKAISDYYKGVGKPLKRGDLYKEYRKIRDDYSNVPLSVLIPQFDRLVIKGQGTRQFPNELQLGIPWYQFEDEMTDGYSQRYFLLNNTIILDLSILTPNVPNMRFPYSQIIGNYKKLYNNITFRQQVKQKGTYYEFQIDWSRSDIKKGIYVFILVAVSATPATTPTPTPIGRIISQQPPGAILPGPIGQVMGFDERSEYIQQITSLRETQKIITQAFKNKDMTYQQYKMEIDDLNDAISDLQNKIDKL